MDFLAFLDSICKGMATASGLGLIGLMIVRINPRGRFKLVGFEPGPVFDPKMKHTARQVTIAFAVCVGILMVRTFFAVV
jgi:hypothetical protein